MIAAGDPPPTPLAAGPVALLANPAAGRGRYGGVLPAVLDRLAGSGRDVRPVVAGSAAEARAGAARAIADGAAALVAVGGDGTVHLALQAVAGRGVPLGIVPAGTGNDFAASVGLPGTPLAAADAVAAALATGRRRVLDLARLTTADGAVTWFGAVLAAGFDAVVNERANRMAFPRGARRYDVAIVAELLRLRPLRYRLVVDGEPCEVAAVLLAVANTPSYGGGMRICPAADPTDGLLDLVYAGPMGRAALMRIKPRVYAGTHVAHPAVVSLRARRVEIAGPPVVTYADGERVAALPVTVEAVPGALQLLG
jgi:diacylglycerol kinase (ATP)